MVTINGRPVSREEFRAYIYAIIEQTEETETEEEEEEEWKIY